VTSKRIAHEFNVWSPEARGLLVAFGRRLLENGHAVRVIDNLSTGNLANLAHVRSIEMIEGDITKSQTVNRPMHGVEPWLFSDSLCVVR